jgi:hypothetical protein
MPFDTHNYGDRAGFLERLSRLSGQTTYRMPMGGRMPYSARNMTTEAALILTLSFSRAGKWDIGPEIVYGIGTGLSHQREKVIQWLVGRIKQEAGWKARKAKNYVNILAQHCYEIVVFGKPQKPIPNRLPICWDELKELAEGLLWMEAENTIERAEYRKWPKRHRT